MIRYYKLSFSTNPRSFTSIFNNIQKIDIIIEASSPEEAENDARWTLRLETFDVILDKCILLKEVNHEDIETNR